MKHKFPEETPSITTYRRSCRCNDCRNANAERSRMWRRGYAPSKQIKKTKKPVTINPIVSSDPVTAPKRSIKNEFVSYYEDGAITREEYRKIHGV